MNASNSLLAPAPGVEAAGAGAAAPADNSARDAVKGSVRRAEEMARSTAARLYGGSLPYAPPAEPEPEPEPEPPPVTAPAPRLPMVAESIGEPRMRAARDAEAMAAEAMRPPERVAASAPASRLPLEAPPSLAAPPSGLADGLETVASLSGGTARLPKAGGKPVVGRRVRVTRGDTVWAIAMQYYGTVDSSVLTEIFRHNPGIRNAHQLPVGSDVFVPFLKPEHMVDPAEGGGYRVLVAESPEASEIAKASSWAASRLPGRELHTATKGRDHPVRMVYATGFTGREAALAAARQLIGPVAP
jgi:nucleoid-associated protein YgaU